MNLICPLNFGRPSYRKRPVATCALQGVSQSVSIKTTVHVATGQLPFSLKKLYTYSAPEQESIKSNFSV